MAHTALHFSIGLAAGMALQAPALRRVWKQGRQLAPAVARWLLVSWAAGLWAIVPSLLRYAGLPESFCSGWWMNLFLLHPLINQFGPHGTLIGGALLVALCSFQYTLVVAAIVKARKVLA